MMKPQYTGIAYSLIGPGYEAKYTGIITFYKSGNVLNELIATTMDTGSEATI